MSTAALISVSEYLSASYRPDCDYVDGAVLERNLGEREHSRMQILLGAYALRHEADWQIYVFTEQRMQVSATRFRIPDICFVDRALPGEQIITVPPVACIEILSRADSLHTLQERIDDYLAFGVRTIWVVDPVARQAYTAVESGILKLPGLELAISGTPIRIPLNEIFAQLSA